MQAGLSQIPVAGAQQQLAVTQELIQSLNILRMPVVELAAFLGECICENPVLDMEALAEVAQPTGEAPEKPEPDVAYEDIWKLASSGGGAQIQAQPSHSEETFTHALLEQVNTERLDEAFRLLCRYLVGCLNPRGYLDIPLEELAEETGAGLFAVTQALYFVQSLHPAGVGARSLQECLLLQLAAGDAFNADTVRLVTAGLPLLAKNNLREIARLLGCTRQEAEACVRAVKALNPIPSRGFYTGEQAGVIIPDAVVHCQGDAVTVRMNDRYLPRLRVCSDYLDTSGMDAESKRYLGQKLKEARALQGVVAQREKTLTSVLRLVVRRQQGFFSAAGPLLPMTQAEIAEELGLHTSTISRALQGKYIAGDFGVLEIKKLFSGAVKAAGSGEVSADTVKRRLQSLLQAENPQKPLSDENLRAVLVAMDIDIARRTVAKYREALGYPPASQRRQR